MTGFECREAMGYDHGYDGEVFYLDPAYVEGIVEGRLESCAGISTPRSNFRWMSLHQA